MHEPAAGGPAPIIPARLRWQGDQPYSTQYGDIYHAPDGPAEVRRVFIEPQQLDERFAAAPAVFTVGELGFGSGLNFAVVAQQFIDCAPLSSQLHFISVEKHPLRTADFELTASRRQHDAPVYRDLARHYPPQLPGWHRRHLAGGRIRLSIFFGDAREGVADIRGRQRTPVDAWLLDGFAPARNPDLWTPPLWDAIAALSAPGTTLATFSAVGAVRRSLADAGFVMRKIDQRPHKRHSLAGVYAGQFAPNNAAARSAVVIGAGIAGAATAWQTAQRGIPVTVLDRATDPPNRLNGTMLHCRVLPETDTAAALRWAGYLYACSWYDQHPTSCHASGVLQFPSTNMTLHRLEAAADFVHANNILMSIDPVTASALVGRRVDKNALYFPRGRAIDLETLCAELLRHPLIDYRRGVNAVSVQTDPERARIETNVGAIDTDTIVLCNAASANDFEQARYLELLSVWGQIDRIEIGRPPAVPLLGDGYVVPLPGGWAIGATYEQRPWTPERASAANLHKFNSWWSDLTGAAPVQISGVPLRGNRAVASDRKPIVGNVFDAELRPIPRLLLNTGHGSQGTASAPFGAEWIASELSGEFAPVTRSQIAAWSSLRFRLRQARRGLRHGARA